MRTFETYARMADEALANHFPESAFDALCVGETAPLLYRAMRYSLLSGGKRVRAALMLAAADMLSKDGADFALPFAMAVEMIHASSLIHDDLPCMDDDVLRRGKPTSHVVFGEGQALLAGDGLLNYAYEQMLNHIVKSGGAHDAVCAAAEIARGAGVRGMMAGQCADLLSESEQLENCEEVLAYIHTNKTAAMFEYPLRAMGRLFQAPEDVVDGLGDYGRKLGLLFQTTDDILDVEGDESLGKSLHKDEASGKLTMVRQYGLNGAKARAVDLVDALKELAARFGRGEAFFSEIADHMANRRK